MTNTMRSNTITLTPEQLSKLSPEAQVEIQRMLKPKMKRIIMKDPVMEAPGSLFPKVRVNAFDAQALCARLIEGGELPTSEEYDRLFALRPWPYLIWEWTSTSEGSSRVLRGGSWPGDFQASLRASACGRKGPGYRYYDYGFRCAASIPADQPVPAGWLDITKEEE